MYKMTCDSKINFLFIILIKLSLCSLQTYFVWILPFLKYRRGNQRRRKTKQKHNTICVWHHYMQTNTNNVNKTWTLLQTTGCKDDPKHCFYAEIVRDKQPIFYFFKSDLMSFFFFSKFLMKFLPVKQILPSDDFWWTFLCPASPFSVKERKQYLSNLPPLYWTQHYEIHFQSWSYVVFFNSNK